MIDWPSFQIGVAFALFLYGLFAAIGRFIDFLRDYDEFRKWRGRK